MSVKKIRSLFRLKDKTPHPACKIYEGTCSCSANCIGETKGIVETRRNEQERIEIKILRSSHRKCSVKKGVLKNISKFTGKHLCQSLFFNTVAGLRFCILNQLNTSGIFLIINWIGKYFSQLLKTRNYVKSWNHQ